MSEEAVEADLAAVTLDCARRGEAALGDYGRPSLSRLAACVRRVAHEAHKLEGFARFSPNKDGIYVACLEPDYNVLPALASFFLGRFGKECFALLDLRREYGIISRPGNDSLFLDSPGREADRREPDFGGAWPFEFLAGTGFSDCLPEADENEEAELWRLYFRTVENKSRHNPALQRCLMPRRYWKNLTEFGAR
jgi:probable DNA metabolism protein